MRCVVKVWAFIDPTCLLTLNGSIGRHTSCVQQHIRMTQIQYKQTCDHRTLQRAKITESFIFHSVSLNTAQGLDDTNNGDTINNGGTC